MVEHGGDGPLEIGEDVFNVTFVRSQDDRFTSAWLMQFYECIFFLVGTGPQGFFDQLGPPPRERRVFGLW
jgi:hypothetical protein